MSVFYGVFCMLVTATKKRCPLSARFVVVNVNNVMIFNCKLKDVRLPLLTVLLLIAVLLVCL